MTLAENFRQLHESIENLKRVIWEEINKDVNNILNKIRRI